MPFCACVATPILYTNLLVCGMLGSETPKLSLGICTGIQKWLSDVKVNTIDTGNLGVGTSQAFLTIPPPILLVSLIKAFSDAHISGAMAPLLALGLSNGLPAALLTAVVFTNHIGVGSGSAIARFQATDATKAMTEGFRAVGLDGAEKMARALGKALPSCFGMFYMNLTIKGSSTPNIGLGKSTGKIL